MIIIISKIDEFKNSELKIFNKHKLEKERKMLQANNYYLTLIQEARD